MRFRAVPKDACAGFGQYDIPKLKLENPTSCLAKSRIVAQPPEPEAFHCVFGLGGFLDEMLCLVKDLTCVGSTLPQSMMHILIVFLAFVFMCLLAQATMLHLEKNVT